MIKLGQQHMGDVTFTHQDPETQEVTLYNVTILQRLVADPDNAGHIELVELPLLPEDRDMFTLDRGIEPHRLARIYYPWPPILACQTGPQEVLTVDGHHRIAKAYEMGHVSITAKMIHPLVWQHCVMDYRGTWFERELRNDINSVMRGFSGIE